MSKGAWGRIAGSLTAVIVVGVVILTLSSPVSAKSGGLVARPAKHLVDEQSVTVTSRSLPAGDYVELIECLRGSTELTGCDPATATAPVAVSATGRLPATEFEVETGVVGTGMCGTSVSDDADCEIAAQDISGTTLFAAYVNITFITTSTTIPTLPTTPNATVP